MITGDPQQDIHPQAGSPRRRVLAAAALAPALAAAAPAPARALGPARVPASAPPGTSRHGLIKPVHTTQSDWASVAAHLGGLGDMKQKTMYHTGFPRRDLRVVSDRVTVKPALALGSHVAFVRYEDGSSLVMGDLVVTEHELQRFCDTLHKHRLAVTALHKHLLAQRPSVWWLHVHGHGHDPAHLARGLRAAFDGTGTPLPLPPGIENPVDLDTDGVEEALGAKGSVDGEIFKCIFVRRERITDGDLVLPPGLGSTTALNFQPLGDGRAAVSGDCAMIAEEVQKVLAALRRAGAELVELHNHGLTDEPRLFFVHFWAVGDAVRLARALRPAMDATNVIAAG
ncbi:DUF1259 domain-containing protein [Streptomyces sp. GS7]|uniref:DUF1259 domain-containing protein n=1 Tax=Streptomyces sp. GS7 TaxID=2692234 RepID=UPI001F378B69|nr:DUF1259 domain-containing protein [Streptomyces sp. GS7]